MDVSEMTVERVWVDCILWCLCGAVLISDEFNAYSLWVRNIIYSALFQTAFASKDWVLLSSKPAKGTGRPAGSWERDLWVCENVVESSNSQGGFARDMISWSKIVHETSAPGPGNTSAELVSGGVCMACMLDSRRCDSIVCILTVDSELRSKLWRWDWMRCRSRCC